MTEDEDYDALSQKHLASLKRDTRVSFEDAVRAVHKGVNEFNPDWDEKAVLVEEMQRMAKELQERNFCPRCGKRTADLTVIHTCTPPQENT